MSAEQLRPFEPLEFPKPPAPKQSPSNPIGQREVADWEALTPSIKALATVKPYTVAWLASFVLRFLDGQDVSSPDGPVAAPTVTRGKVVPIGRGPRSEAL